MRMVCAEGMAQESRCLQALDTVTRCRIDGDRLELLDAHGAVRAQLRAVALR